MQIRAERPSDTAAIHALTVGAFADSPYGYGGEAEIVDALRADEALIVSLVAERDGEVVGHVGFSRVAIESGEDDWFGLAPLSVRPGDQGRGVGSRLVEAGLERLKALGAAGCVVLGDPRYYGRFGFQSEPGLSFEGKSTPYLQRLVLGGPPPRGEVRYHRAFGG